LSREFGDFQTPPSLVQNILERLSSSGETWSRALEPTCGRGNFIEGLLKLPTPPQEIQAIELQDNYIQNARDWVKYSSSTRVTIRQSNIFDLNFQKDLQWSDTGRLLVVGNPPWVTNSELGSLGSENLPLKSNIKNLKGIDARTGGSNFDIAEYIWLKRIKELASEQPTIALLCKISVARNILQFAFDAHLPITHASIYMINAKKWFGAAVEACLFRVEIGTGEPRYEAAVYQDLCATEPDFITGIVEKRLVTDMKAYRLVASTDGVCPVTWRQGLKHDAASVMELIYDSPNKLINKLGETVIVESEYLYPLLKSSDLYHGTNDKPKRAIIVTQKKLGEDTYHLKQNAPLLWNYLTTHINIFEQRKSSIYIERPSFAIFGVGEYSFAPYKIGISGFYKSPRFRAIGPINGRPVMLDDTCYFIPCYTAKETAFLASLLNDPVCLKLIESMIFLDAKRPVTKKLLQRINLVSLFDLVDKQALIKRATTELELLEGTLKQEKTVWPSSMENYLIEYFQNVGHTVAKKRVQAKRQVEQGDLFSDRVTMIK